MTNHDLNKLYRLNKDIERLEARIEELEDPSPPRITGLPHGTNITDRTSNTAIKLSALRLRLEAARIEAIDELMRLTDYIESIDDPIIRQIMQFRHIDGLNWEKVADKIGGGMTGESCRKAHWRYLKEK